MLYGNLASGQVNDRHWDEKGADFTVAAICQGFMVPFDCRQTTHPRTDDNTDALGIIIVNFQA